MESKESVPQPRNGRGIIQMNQGCDCDVMAKKVWLKLPGEVRKLFCPATFTLLLLLFLGGLKQFVKAPNIEYNKAQKKS
jgi:hypothetical protein